MTTAYLIPAIKRDEGLKLTAYPDPITHAAPWTIGYGATGPGIVQGTVWTQAQADADLASRVNGLTAQLASMLPWFDNLSGPRQDVLVNMAYNLGLVGLLGFHNTLSYMQNGNWQAASDGMLASLWAKQVGDRARRLAQQMLTGANPDAPAVDPAPIVLPITPAPVAAAPQQATAAIPTFAETFMHSMAQKVWTAAATFAGAYVGFTSNQDQQLAALGVSATMFLIGIGWTYLRTKIDTERSHALLNASPVAK